MSERSRTLQGLEDRCRDLADLLAELRIAPILDALDERWPEGWHASDSLHEFDCTPADFDYRGTFGPDWLDVGGRNGDPQ